MRLYVDTEFTDFIECDLISIALVADDGREFYGERPDYDESACRQFVRAAVLPQLGQYPGRVFTREGLRTTLLAWLDQFAGPPERILRFDYEGIGGCCWISLASCHPAGTRNTSMPSSIPNGQRPTIALTAAGITRCSMRALIATRRGVSTSPRQGSDQITRSV